MFQCILHTADLTLFIINSIQRIEIKEVENRIGDWYSAHSSFEDACTPYSGVS